jgi:hypothetical protein
MKETALFVGEDSSQDGLRLDSSARNALSLGATLVVRCAAGNGPKGQFWGSRHSDSGWRWPALALFLNGASGDEDGRQQAPQGHAGL